MSEKEKKLMTVCLVLMGLVVLFLLLRKYQSGRGGSAKGGDSYNVEGSNVGGTTIGDTIIGGSNIAPPSNSYNWGEGDYYEAQLLPPNYNAYQNYFNSENNISTNTFGLNELSQKYIPMFGLVGMTAVGNIVVQQNVTQEAPVGRMQAAPQQVYQAATAKQYQGYMGNAESLKRYGGQGSIGAEMQLRRAAKEGTLKELLNR